MLLPAARRERRPAPPSASRRAPTFPPLPPLYSFGASIQVSPRQPDPEAAAATSSSSGGGGNHYSGGRPPEEAARDGTTQARTPHRRSVGRFPARGQASPPAPPGPARPSLLSGLTLPHEPPRQVAGRRRRGARRVPAPESPLPPEPRSRRLPAPAGHRLSLPPPPGPRRRAASEVCRQTRAAAAPSSPAAAAGPKASELCGASDREREAPPARPDLAGPASLPVRAPTRRLRGAPLRPLGVVVWLPRCRGGGPEAGGRRGGLQAPACLARCPGGAGRRGSAGRAVAAPCGA